MGNGFVISVKEKGKENKIFVGSEKKKTNIFAHCLGSETRKQIISYFLGSEKRKIECIPVVREVKREKNMLFPGHFQG